MNPDLSLRVSVFSEQGGRKYMEDLTEVIVELEPSDDELRAAGHTDPKPDQEPISESDPPDCRNKPLPVTVTWRNTLSTEESDGTEPAADSRRSVAFFAVFDGHGGREAALFARDHLWDFSRSSGTFGRRITGKFVPQFARVSSHVIMQCGKSFVSQFKTIFSCEWCWCDVSWY